MISRKITIRNPEGLHMRPAAVFAEEMGKYECEITIITDNDEVNAKSILSIMTAHIKCGTEIDLKCNGTDETEAMDRAVSLISSEFRSV